MAHWAQIDENNIVINVTVTDNNDPNGDEGYQWLIDNIGGIWIKTSFNANIRKKFAGIGDYYDSNLDGFIPPKPMPSFLFDQDQWQWVHPKPKPDGIEAEWSESSIKWIEKPSNGLFEWFYPTEEWLELPDSGYQYFNGTEWVEINSDNDSAFFNKDTKEWVRTIK